MRFQKCNYAGSCDSSISNVLRNHHDVFHSDCTNLKSHQQFTKPPVFPTTTPAFVISCLFNDGQRETGLLGTFLKAREAWYSLHSHFPWWEKLWARKASFSSELCCFGRGTRGK